MAAPQSCDVVVIGAGLSGLYAARLLAAAGVDVVVMEAQSRVGGRTLTGHFSDGTFVDDGGQWVSPGQHCIVGLAEELGVRLFPSWSEGAIVHWRDGARTVTEALFLPEDGDAALAVRESAAALVGMAETLPPEEPWAAPEAAEWDRTTLHSWLAAHVGSVPGRRALASAIEGVFSRNSTPTSLLAALFWIRCGDPLTPFLATNDTGPELRFDGGAQQLSERMADAIGERVVLSAPVSSIAHGPEGVRVTSGELSISGDGPSLRSRPPWLAACATSPRFQRCAIISRSVSRCGGRSRSIACISGVSGRRRGFRARSSAMRVWCAYAQTIRRHRERPGCWSASPCRHVPLRSARDGADHFCPLFRREGRRAA
jgi:monoamine oxidase